MPLFRIQNMDLNDAKTAVTWAEKEGWNPGLNDSQVFFETDPQGFFAGYLDHELIAVGSAVFYGEQYSFLGLYIVKPEYRDHGYGMQMTDVLLDRAKNRTAGIDGVVSMAPKYEKLGFIPFYKQTRFERNGHFPSVSTSELLLNTHIPFAQLVQFDRKFFPADRSLFLKKWISQDNAHTIAYMDNGVIQGYGVIRKCVQGYKIGPLFADKQEIADTLFNALCSHARAGPVYLDIPDPQQRARELADTYNMTPKFEVIRMYRNGAPDVGIEGVYGVTSFELG